MSERIQIILYEILHGNRKNVDGMLFSVSELLSKDSKGITFLENLLKRKIELDPINNNVIKNSIYIAYLYCIYKKSLDFFELSEDDLFLMINGRTYVEYFILKGKVSLNMLKVISNRVDIVDFLINNKGTRYLKQINSEIVRKLSTKNSDGVYIIEKYVKNKKIFNVLISLIDNPKVLLELSLKYNNFALLKDASERVLMSYIDNSKPFLIYLMNDLNIAPKILKNSFSNEFAVFLYNNGLYDYLLNDEYFLIEVEPGKTMLEALIEKGCKFESINVDDEQVFRVLYKCNRLDIIGVISARILKKTVKEVLGLNDCNDNELLLVYLLDNGYNPFKNCDYIKDENIVRILCKKRRIDFLEKISYDVFLSMEDGSICFNSMLEAFKDNMLLSNELVTPGVVDRIFKYSVITDKYGISDYISKVDKDILLSKHGNKTMLYRLLDADKDFPQKNVLSKSVWLDNQIISKLKSKGIVFKRDNMLFSDDEENYEKLITRRYGIGPLPEEGEMLLKELEQLFLSDGKSDKDLIEILISGYRQSLFINYEVYINEIKNLIFVKKRNKRFYYKKTDKGSCFDCNNGSIYCNNFSLDTLMHETGHALHYYLANSYIPEEFYIMVNKMVNNQKIEKFVNDFYELKKLIELLVKQRYLELFGCYHYDESKKKEINDILDKEQKLRKEKFEKLGILDFDFNSCFTYEQFIRYQVKLFTDNKIKRLMSNEFEYLCSICDILDALCSGNLHDEKLEVDGKKIKSIPGHGRLYYNDLVNQFYEIIANFSNLLKSKDADFCLKLLQSLIGDDLYNLIDDFYSSYLVDGNYIQLDVGRKII